jgi:putative membrane protein
MQTRLLLGITAFMIGALSFVGVANAQTRKSKTSATAQTAATNQEGSLSQSDRAFMKKAAQGGEMEVAMGKLAEEHATNEDVKAFGKRMVTDHSKANDELRTIAQKKGVTLPSKNPSVKWTSDKKYISAMVKDHEMDLAEFQKEASEAKDPDLKQFAEQTAKVVQEHLDLAKNTQGKL